MTYKEIQKYYKNKYNGSIKTCWIVELKDNQVYQRERIRAVAVG